MKKRIALMLAAVMLLAIPAFAEENTETTETTETTEVNTAIETAAETEDAAETPAVSYEGEWAFIAGPQGYGFDIYLPAGWTGEMLTDAEETEETAVEINEAAESIYYTATSEDGAWTMTAAYDDVGEEKDATALQQELIATFEDAAVVSINGYDYIRYTDAVNDSIVLILPEATGMHTFTFSPVSDADYATIADEMVGTLAVYEAEGEAAVEEEPVELNAVVEEETTEESEG